MFCKHEWMILSEIATKSKYETAIDAIGGRAMNLKLPWQLCDAERKYIQTFSCKKCGKLKRFVEVI